VKALSFFQYWAVPEKTMLLRLKSMSLLEFDNALRPKAVTWAIAGWLLRDSKPEGFERSNRLWVLHFTIAWSEEGTQTLTLPDSTEVLTMMGNPIKFTGGKIAVGKETVFVRGKRGRGLMAQQVQIKTGQQVFFLLCQFGR
jgi:hypothetical protein